MNRLPKPPVPDLESSGMPEAPAPPETLREAGLSTGLLNDLILRQRGDKRQADLMDDSGRAAGRADMGHGGLSSAWRIALAQWRITPTLIRLRPGLGNAIARPPLRAPGAIHIQPFRQ